MIKRAFVLTGLFVRHFLLEVCMIVYCSISGIFSAPLLGKLALISLYTIIILLAIYSRVACICVIMLILFAAILLAFWMTKEDAGGSRYTMRENRSNSTKKKNPFFDGMNQEEAKKEYKKLLEIYHPDDKSGDLEKMQEVVVAYSEYCSEHNCR